MSPLVQQILIALVVPVVGFAIWFIRDRRKSRAESEVAERTVGADVRIRDVASLEAHIAFVERAFGVERESKDRQIGSLDQQVQQLRAVVHDRDEQVRQLHAVAHDRDEQIAGLRDEVAELKMQVSLLKALTEKFTRDNHTA